jgi:CCR4-NOT transcription complex subunit 1
MITLGKNKQLPKEDVDLKRLLTESYGRGNEQLIFVVQFMSKVLESCSEGRFSVKNSWTISMMNSLFELYEKPDVKLQVRIEIEILCKKLNIKLEFNQ